MTVDNSFVYIDSGISATINLIELFGLKIPRRAVRDFFFKESNGRPATIRNIRTVLQQLAILPVIYKIDENELMVVGKNPFLTWFVNEDSSSEYVCVIRTSAESVDYINEYSLEVKVSREEFLVRWSKIILLANPETGIEDCKIVEEEQELRQSFKTAIQIIDNFLDKEMCDKIITHCNSNHLFDRSKVSLFDNNKGGVPGDISVYRTSDTAKLLNSDDLPGLYHVYDNIGAQLQVPNEKMEHLQCVRYFPGTFFSPHFDTGPEFVNPRKFTIIIYLNDDFTGGETYFPELGYKIKPSKGMAVIFDNLLSNNTDFNPFSLHAGLPVTSGVKYICTIWTRMNEYDA